MKISRPNSIRPGNIGISNIHPYPDAANSFPVVDPPPPAKLESQPLFGNTLWSPNYSGTKRVTIGDILELYGGELMHANIQRDEETLTTTFRLPLNESEMIHTFADESNLSITIVVRLAYKFLADVIGDDDTQLFCILDRYGGKMMASSNHKPAIETTTMTLRLPKSERESLEQLTESMHLSMTATSRLALYHLIYEVEL